MAKSHLHLLYKIKNPTSRQYGINCLYLQNGYLKQQPNRKTINNNNNIYYTHYTYTLAIKCPQIPYLA